MTWKYVIYWPEDGESQTSDIEDVNIGELRRGNPWWRTTVDLPDLFVRESMHRGQPDGKAIQIFVRDD